MNRISILRKSKGLSQTQLAARIGISQNTLSQYETGARPVSSRVLLVLSDFFDASPSYILGQSDEKKAHHEGDKQFKISDVKEIIELEDEAQANVYLSAGWVLLHIGQQSNSDGSTIVYILGRDSSNVQHPQISKIPYDNGENQPELW